MPGLSARSANKNVSRAKRAAFSKNNSRVEGALTEDLQGYCTFGKIFKNFGNGRFLVIKSDKREHLCSMRGSIAKAIRPSVDDVVLLSIRDYETRATIANGVNAVYDIIASLDKKAVGKLIKAKTVPRWMNGKAADVVSGAAQNDLDEDDIFDYDDDDDDESDADESTSNNITKKDKKNHRNTAAGGGGTSARDSDDDDDVDVDAI